MRFVIMIVLPAALGLAACGDGLTDREACAAAWEEATSVGELDDTHDDFRSTLSRCRTVDDWNRENEANGERLMSGTSTIVNLCETLGESTRLCRSATELEAEETSSNNQGLEAPDVGDSRQRRGSV